MNNQVPNTDPSLSDEQVVRQFYPDASQWSFGTYHDGEPFYRVYDTPHVKTSSQLLGYGWADARSKLPAAVSEVDGGTEAEPKFYARCGYCERKWMAVTDKEPCPVCTDVPFEQKGSPYFDRLNHAEPVAPQGTVEGETRARKIITRVVTNAVQSLWTRQIEPLDDDPDAEFPTEEELIIDALSLALGDDIGCLDEKDEDFRERIDLLWLEDLLAESVAPPSVAMQDILTDNCILCGFEKDEHYDGVQCPIAHGKYHATQVFSSRIDAPLVPNPQKLLTELPALNVSNDDLVKACDTWRGEEDKYEIQAEVYCRERQLLAALNEIETLRPLAIMVAKSSGEGSGVPELPEREHMKQFATALHSYDYVQWPEFKRYSDALLAQLKAALSSPLQEGAGWIEIKEGCLLPEYGDVVTMINSTTLGGPYQETCDWNLAGDWNEAEEAGVLYWKPIDWPPDTKGGS